MSNELEKIERQLEQTEDDEITISLLYRKIDILQAKANKYDSLVEKIKDKDKEVEYRLNDTMIIERDTYYNLGKKEVLQELLDAEKER